MNYYFICIKQLLRICLLMTIQFTKLVTQFLAWFLNKKVIYNP